MKNFDRETSACALPEALSTIASFLLTLNEKRDLRVLPSFVVDAIFMWACLILGIASSDLQHFRFVEKLVVEAEHFLVLRIGGDTRGCWSHCRGKRILNLTFYGSVLACTIQALIIKVVRAVTKVSGRPSSSVAEVVWGGQANDGEENGTRFLLRPEPRFASRFSQSGHPQKSTHTPVCSSQL